MLLVLILKGTELRSVLYVSGEIGIICTANIAVSRQAIYGIMTVLKSISTVEIINLYHLVIISVANKNQLLGNKILYRCCISVCLWF